MKAAIIRKYGGPEVVQVVANAPEPEMRADDILVEVRAASVNPVDLKIRDGALRRLVKLDLPIVMGNDLAGVVVATGPAVKRFRAGQRVFARVEKTRLGAFAERAVVKESYAAAIPAGQGFEEAAALPLVSLTAWQALVDMAEVKPGDRVLIHAGAGGVGSVAIQIAKHLGALVATTASRRNAELCRSLGASQVIDYTAEDFAARLKDVDVVLDTIGGDTQMRSFEVLRKGGILVAVTGTPDAAFAKSAGMSLPIRAALGAIGWSRSRLVKRLGVRYKFLFMWPSGEELARIADLWAMGKLRPVVDRTYPLDQVKLALSQVEEGHARGKVVIKVR